MPERHTESSSGIDPEDIPTIRREAVWLGSNNCRCGKCLKYFPERLVEGPNCPEPSCGVRWKFVIVGQQRTMPIPERFNSLIAHDGGLLEAIWRRHTHGNPRLSGRTIQIAWANPDYL